MKKHPTTILKGKTVSMKSVKGEWEVSTVLPNGKPFILEFKKASDFVEEVPTEVWYVDDFKKEIRFHENYAQFLIDNYNKKDQYGEVSPDKVHLEIVEIKEAPIVVGEVVKTAPISKRKVKTNEE